MHKSEDAADAFAIYSRLWAFSYLVSFLTTYQGASQTPYEVMVATYGAIDGADWYVLNAAFGLSTFAAFFFPCCGRLIFVAHLLSVVNVVRSLPAIYDSEAWCFHLDSSFIASGRSWSL